jgi:hypothetical protein
VFWLDILDQRPGDGLLIVKNLYDAGKLVVPLIQDVIEAKLVFPFLRGRDVRRWIAKPSAYILVAQDPKTRSGYDEQFMMIELHNTYRYLKHFEAILRARSGYRKFFDQSKDAFYSQYDVADYTFAPFRVMWRQMVPAINAVVTSSVDDPFLGTKVTVTQHVVTLIPFQTAVEAHYVCAVLNSAVVS